MKYAKILLGTVGALALCGSAQAEHFHGWYVGIEGGANAVQKDKFADLQPGDLTDPLNHIQQTFDTGWAAFGSVGYAFYNWRIEGEFGYRQNGLDKTKTPATLLDVASTTKTSGHLSEFTLMANVLYDIHLTDRFAITLGAGAGGADSRLKLAALDDGVAAEGEFIKDSHYSFAYQGLAGLNYYIGPRSTLFINYRYLDVTNPNFAVAGESAKFDDLRSHTVTLGLRFDLAPDEEPAPPPPPPPPPAPPPPPPPAVTHFIIFFGFNKCNITSEADGVLSQAASTAKSTGAASISIVGHTDTSGSSKYNQKLSVCRADAAKSNLVGKGVPEGSIAATGKGETELMVQTGDNVKEPQNRRATVDLH